MEIFSPKKRKKTAVEEKLTALTVLLIGLFVGSLFVDLGQLFTGRGFSGHVAASHNVLESTGKTWVAYLDPKVSLELLTDKDCTTCSADEALIWLRRVLPTLEVENV